MYMYVLSEDKLHVIVPQKIKAQAVTYPRSLRVALKLVLEMHVGVQCPLSLYFLESGLVQNFCRDVRLIP